MTKSTLILLSGFALLLGPSFFELSNRLLFFSVVGLFSLVTVGTFLIMYATHNVYNILFKKEKP